MRCRDDSTHEQCVKEFGLPQVIPPDRQFAQALECMCRRKRHAVVGPRSDLLPRPQGESESCLGRSSVGVTQVGEHIWLVTFMHYDLGYFDDETCRLEPIENPFGPKVLPMCSE